MRPFLFAMTLISGLAVYLADCASSAAGMADTAYKSRGAAVIRYDEQYAKELATQVEQLRSKASGGERSDRVSLLFALDELAEIHAYRLVDFQRALGFNREAETVLDTLGSHVDAHAQGQP